MPTSPLITTIDRPPVQRSDRARSSSQPFNQRNVPARETDTIIEAAADSDRAMWDAYTSSHREATLFHTEAWLRSITRVFGHRPCHLWARRDGRVVGVLPLFEIRGLIAGTMLVSVPYATYGGVIAEDETASQALLDYAKAMARQLRARCVELRSLRAADSHTPIRSSHVMFIRSLPKSPEDVLKMIPRKARAAARRAQERYDLRVEYGPHQVDEVWSLYSRSMRRLGSPNYPRLFFRELADDFRDTACWQVVRQGHRAVAGLLTFYHRDRAMPYFVGIDERRGLYGLSNYVYWQSMGHAVERGCTLYDFGRTRVDNHGPYEFKRSFGFEPTPLEYQVWVSPGRRAPDLSPTSPRWRLARNLWKHLPLAITRPLGAWAARSIPG